MCATHRNLLNMVQDSLFRIDLYARISTFVLHIKPLDQRLGDVVPIVREIGVQLKCPDKAQEFLDKYMEKITNHELSLALNVRSLEQFVKRYSVLGRV